MSALPEYEFKRLPKWRNGASKAGDREHLQWRQTMQIRWLEAAIAAQERRDEPEMDLNTLRMKCPQT